MNSHSDRLIKWRRNYAVRDMRERYPDMSLAEIGQDFAITRQRVWQILNDPRFRLRPEHTLPRTDYTQTG